MGIQDALRFDCKTSRECDSASSSFLWRLGTQRPALEVDGRAWISPGSAIVEIVGISGIYLVGLAVLGVVVRGVVLAALHRSNAGSH